MSFSQGDFWPTGGTLHGRALFCVTKTFTYDDGLVRVTIPDGFVFDGPSIPFWALPFCPVGRMFLPAALHDWLLWRGTPDADRIFYRALRSVGVSNPMAKILYGAVRFGTFKRALAQKIAAAR